MEKKKLRILILGSILIIGVALGVYQAIRVNNKEIDAIKFKAEYESINGQENSSNKNYAILDINKDNPMIYADYDKVFEVLNGTGVIFFGFKECPWCRTAIPVLL